MTICLFRPSRCIWLDDLAAGHQRTHQLSSVHVTAPANGANALRQVTLVYPFILDADAACMTIVRLKIK